MLCNNFRVIFNIYLKVNDYDEQTVVQLQTEKLNRHTRG